MDEGKIKILLVEKNAGLGFQLKEFLRTNGFFVKKAKNEERANNLFDKKMYNLCLLDINKETQDGFGLAQQIRTKDKNIPIIFFGANPTKEDIIKGLNIGADDYIAKPLHMKELLARINAVLRRSMKKNEAPTEISIGKYIFNNNKRTLATDQHLYKLSSKETILMHLLTLNKNEFIERSFILQTIWHNDSYLANRSMGVYLSKLRKFLMHDSSIEITNLPRIGVKLIIKI